MHIHPDLSLPCTYFAMVTLSLYCLFIFIPTKTQNVHFSSLDHSYTDYPNFTFVSLHLPGSLLLRSSRFTTSPGFDHLQIWKLGPLYTSKSREIYQKQAEVPVNISNIYLSLGQIKTFHSNFLFSVD